jgi:hypothetical protein
MGMSGQLHAPASLTLGKNTVTHSVGDWVSPRAGLYVEVKRKTPAPTCNRIAVVLLKTSHFLTERLQLKRQLAVFEIAEITVTPPPPLVQFVTIHVRVFVFSYARDDVTVIQVFFFVTENQT